MTNDLITTAELATSIGASGLIATGINAEPLLTALITFIVSIITIVGGEVVKFLVAYFKKKTKELEEKEKEK